MNRRLFIFSFFAASVFLLTSCAVGGGGGGESSGMTYKDMKSMVIDILKTEDAQKALQEAASSQSGYTAQSATMLSAQDQEQVRLAVKDVLLSPEYDSVLKGLMTDTKFAGEFSKAVNEMNKDLHVQLIKDPQYQKGLAEAFQNEDLQKVILKVVKGPDYRKELMSLMQDSFNNPIFKMQMFELMKKAVAEELAVKPQEKGGSGKEGGEESKSEEESSKEGQETEDESGGGS